MQKQQVRAGKIVYDSQTGIRGTITSSQDTMVGLGNYSKIYIHTVNLVVLTGTGKIKKNTVLRNVPIEVLEEGCEELFPLGTKVQSLLGKGFEGEVTGYEYQTNKVVCKALKSQKQSRTRYSYGVNEIRPIVEKQFDCPHAEQLCYACILNGI